MTENAPIPTQGACDPLSMASLVDSSLRPDGSISLTFSDGVVHVMLDQTGDWTITAGLSVLSDRLLSLTRSLEELGFFQARSEEHTSELQSHSDLVCRLLLEKKNSN